MVYYIPPRKVRRSGTKAFADCFGVCFENDKRSSMRGLEVEVGQDQIVARPGLHAQNPTPVYGGTCILGKVVDISVAESGVFSPLSDPRNNCSCTVRRICPVIRERAL